MTKYFFCSVVRFRNAYAYIAPVLISRNLSLNVANFLCSKTNNIYVVQFLMNAFFRENHSVISFPSTFL